MRCIRQLEDPEKIKSSHLHIKDCQALNSHLLSSSNILFQTIYPLEQKLDWRQQADRIHRKAELLHSDVKEGPALNSHHEILQTTSSNIVSSRAEV